MCNQKYNGISVIIPVYNSEKYISQCLDSIINQQYKKLEIICVDDGSTDNSGQILDEYAAKDSRVKVIHKTNGGASAARNAGINLATMPVITFVDSDDTIQSDMYSALLNRMESESLDCVCCNYKIVKSNGTTAINSRFANQTLYEDDIREDVVKCLIGFSSQSNNCLCSLCNKLFLSSIIKENNIRINEKRIHGEDWQFCVEYYAAINSIGFLDAHYYNYHHRTNSLVSRPRKNHFELSIETNQLFKNLFPDFDWESGKIIYKLNGLPFEATLHYRIHYKRKELRALLEEIYYLCKKSNYFQDFISPNEMTFSLHNSLKNNDINTFIKELKKQTTRDYVVHKVKNIIKTILKKA